MDGIRNANWPHLPRAAKYAAGAISPQARILGCGLMLIALFTPQRCLAQEAANPENFNGGAAGWTIVGDAQDQSVQPTYRAGGGNPAS